MFRFAGCIKGRFGLRAFATIAEDKARLARLDTTLSSIQAKTKLMQTPATLAALEHQRDDIKAANKMLQKAVDSAPPLLGKAATLQALTAKRDSLYETNAQMAKALAPTVVREQAPIAPSQPTVQATTVIVERQPVYAASSPVYHQSIPITNVVSEQRTARSAKKTAPAGGGGGDGSGAHKEETLNGDDEPERAWNVQYVFAAGVFAGGCINETIHYFKARAERKLAAFEKKRRLEDAYEEEQVRLLRKEEEEKARIEEQIADRLREIAEAEAEQSRLQKQLRKQRQ
jgi:hypothetical protein